MRESQGRGPDGNPGDCRVWISLARASHATRVVDELLEGLFQNSKAEAEHETDPRPTLSSAMYCA